jgi:predicted nucleotidyltransferase component of viral defense system
MVHVYLDAQPTEGVGQIRIKIEMNIAETRPHGPMKTIRHNVKTSWWSGEADIPTYETSELLATKLRALYQRSKGRDLFDLWLGLTILNTDPDQIIAGFNHYMQDAAFSFPELRDNLAAKLGSTRFLRDLNTLVTNTPTSYNPDTAADLVMRELASRLRNAPPADEITPLRSGPPRTSPSS